MVCDKCEDEGWILVHFGVNGQEITQDYCSCRLGRAEEAAVIANDEVKAAKWEIAFPISHSETYLSMFGAVGYQDKDGVYWRRADECDGEYTREDVKMTPDLQSALDMAPSGDATLREAVVTIEQIRAKFPHLWPARKD